MDGRSPGSSHHSCLLLYRKPMRPRWTQTHHLRNHEEVLNGPWRLTRVNRCIAGFRLKASASMAHHPATPRPGPLHRPDIRPARKPTAFLSVGVAPFASCAVGGLPAAPGTGEGVQAWSRREPIGAPKATAAGARAVIHSTPGDRCHDCGTVGDTSRRLPAAPRREP